MIGLVVLNDRLLGPILISDMRNLGDFVYLPKV